MLIMSVIAVAGAGHGGLTAAIKLASEGYDVTVYEKKKKEECGLEQIDSFDASAMDYAGFEIPDGWLSEPNELTFHPLDDSVEPITVPVSDDYRNITVDRKELFAYLSGLAEKSGVKFRYETEIISPIMLGGRVCGFKTTDGDVYADLVIDASGINSPLRMNLPDYLNIQKEPELYDYLNTYRAYFRRSEGVPDPKYRYSLYIKEDTGFDWLITEKDFVDALIIRFTPLTYPDIAKAMNRLCDANPQMSHNIIKNGKIVKISISQCTAVFVADGYAAVGDSAFMTQPFKGSGIAYSIKAGTMLADTVTADKNGIYSAATLWDYEKNYFKEIGFNACRIALVKNMLPYMSAKEVNEIFAAKLVTNDDLKAFISGNIPAKQFPFILKQKTKVLGTLPEFKSQLLMLLGWVGKLALLEPFFPNEYTPEDAAKWAERYNNFFESVRKPTEDITEEE